MSAIIVPMDKIRAGRRLLAAAAPDQVGMRLAAALHVAGVTPSELQRTFNLPNSAVSQWLSGRNRPDLSNILLMLPYIDVDLQFLLLGDVGQLSYAKRDALAEAMTRIQAALDSGEADTPGRALQKIRSG